MGSDAPFAAPCVAPLASATSTQRLFQCLRAKPQRTRPTVANTRITPHVHMSVRHYANIWRTERATEGRALPPSDWEFLQREVLPIVGHLAVADLFQATQGLLPLPKTTLGHLDKRMEVTGGQCLASTK